MVMENVEVGDRSTVIDSYLGVGISIAPQTNAVGQVLG